MWPSALSGRLCIIVLVGLYPANQLMHRRSIRAPSPKGCFTERRCLLPVHRDLFSVSRAYSRCAGRFPTCYSPVRHSLVIHRQLGASTINQLGQCVRLACIRHAASVHPEPGSNSPFDLYSDALRLVFMIVFQVQRIDVVSSCIYFVFPVRFSKSVVSWPAGSQSRSLSARSLSVFA